MPLAMSRPWKHPNSGVYWLRKGVPEDLRTLVGKREEKRSLQTSLTMPSLVGNHLIICDLGNQDLKKMPLHDIEQALYAVAGGETNQRLCLLVPEDHEVLARQGWQAAVAKIGLIVEGPRAARQRPVWFTEYIKQTNPRFE